MKKLIAVSHTGVDRIERWLVVRAIDTTEKEQVKKVKADIKAALTFLVPTMVKYDRDHDVNYGPYADEFEVSEAAYREILLKFPDGDILPREKWFTVLDEMGITNERDAHSFAMNEEV